MSSPPLASVSSQPRSRHGLSAAPTALREAPIIWESSVWVSRTRTSEPVVAAAPVVEDAPAAVEVVEEVVVTDDAPASTEVVEEPAGEPATETGPASE